MNQKKGCVEIDREDFVDRIKQGLNGFFKIKERGATLSTELLGYSIHDGIAFGFIFYTLMMAVAGRKKQLNPVIYTLTGLFIFNYIVQYVIIYQ